MQELPLRVSVVYCQREGRVCVFTPQFACLSCSRFTVPYCKQTGVWTHMHLHTYDTCLVSYVYAITHARIPWPCIPNITCHRMLVPVVDEVVAHEQNLLLLTRTHADRASLLNRGSASEPSGDRKAQALQASTLGAGSSSETRTDDQGTC